MCLACDCRKVCSQREPLNRILGIVRPCFAARASSRFFPQHHRFGKDNMQRLAATSEALHLHIKLITLVKY